MDNNSMRMLNRDQIKYLAIALMTLDHVIQIFPVCSGITYEFLDALTHFTYITMSYFLVEGFFYTSSRIKYVKRIFLFAVISQVPYDLAFSGDGIFSFYQFNIFFSLGIGLVMIWAIDTAAQDRMKILYAAIGMAACSVCDWSVFAALFTLLFYLSRGNRKKQIRAYVIDAVSFGLINSMIYAEEGTVNIVLIFFISMIGIALSAVCILFFYNGIKSEKYVKLNKWFFYIYYPLHLLVIGILRLVLLM